MPGQWSERSVVGPVSGRAAGAQRSPATSVSRPPTVDLALPSPAVRLPDAPGATWFSVLLTAEVPNWSSGSAPAGSRPLTVPRFALRVLLPGLPVPLLLPE